MEKVIINGKEYSIDIEKCKEQGLLVEKVNYPKDWKDFVTNPDTAPGDTISARVLDKGAYYGNYDHFDTTAEAIAFVALGKLIQLRDWWWDNMCDGWRPCVSFCFTISYNRLRSTPFNLKCSAPDYNHILSFPTSEIRDKFFETYRDLIEEAKMFL